MEMKLTKTEQELIYRCLDLLRTVLVLDLSLAKDTKIKGFIKDEITGLDKLKERIKLKRKLNAERKTEKLLD